jgi:hypothetical protein
MDMKTRVMLLSIDLHKFTVFQRIDKLIYCTMCSNFSKIVTTLCNYHKNPDYHIKAIRIHFDTAFN